MICSICQREIETAACWENGEYSHYGGCPQPEEWITLEPGKYMNSDLYFKIMSGEETAVKIILDEIDDFSGLIKAIVGVNIS